MTTPHITMYDFASGDDPNEERVFAVAWVDDDDSIIIEFADFTPRRAAAAKDAIERGMTEAAIVLPAISVHMADVTRARLLHALLGDAITVVDARNAARIDEGVTA